MPRRPPLATVRLLLALRAAKRAVRSRVSRAVEGVQRWERAAAARRAADVGPPGWDAAATAAAAHYERRHAAAAAATAALLGCFIRLFFGPVSAWWTPDSLLWHAFSPRAPLRSGFTWLSTRSLTRALWGAPLTASLSDEGHMVTMPPADGLLRTLADAATAAVPGTLLSLAKLAILAAGVYAYRYGWEVVRVHSAELRAAYKELRQRFDALFA